MRHVGIFILIILLLTPINLADAQLPTSKPSVSFKVTRVVWGDNPDNPIKAHPGDTEVPLTVEVQNLSPNETIKGVKATLDLGDGPLKDIYGNANATATGKPEISEVLSPTDEIKPKGFFTLTFSLDISEDALPGKYRYNMLLEYSVNCSGIFLEGEPKTLTVEVIISKKETTISCSVSPKSVEKGELIEVSGTIDPAVENVTVNLQYKSPNGTIFNRTATTDAEGYYEDSFQPNLEGSWSINASWAGDEKHEGAWTTTSFEVRFPLSIDVLVSKSRIVGGFDNELNITIINNGQVEVSKLELTLNVPSPLIIHGDNKWSFEYLPPGSSTSITVELYAPPTSIGSTYSGSISLSYRDDYGESHSESHPLGLIVVGWIDLIVYGQSVAPNPASPGDKISIIATVLNKGNVAAMYVNASIERSPILDLTCESAAYMGEVEENSPAPFTLIAWVKDDAQEGRYPITVKITYRDDQYVDHELNFTIYLVVEKSQGQSGGANVEAPVSSLTEIIAVSIVTVIVTLTVILLYRRRFSSKIGAVGVSES